MRHAGTALGNQIYDRGALIQTPIKAGDVIRLGVGSKLVFNSSTTILGKRATSITIRCNFADTYVMNRDSK